MSRYQIVFLIVVGAVALFIASMAASMLPSKETLANGYQVSVGKRGETWVRSADRQTLVTEVTSVWFTAPRMLVERRTLDDTPPYRERDCDYLVADGAGSLRPLSKAEAVALAPRLARETNSAKSCIR